MAERRMFAKTIIDSDMFLDMPIMAQLLYFHLSMNGDDDGFINKQRTVMRTIGASEKDANELVARGYLIPFENGISVISHWRIHNYIPKDRYTPTKFQAEKAILTLNDSKVYVVSNGVSDTECIQSISRTDTQDSIGKDRVDKDSVGEGNMGEPLSPKKPIRHKYGEYQNVLLSDEELDKLREEFPDWQERIERLSVYMESHGKNYNNHYTTILKWAQEDREKAHEGSIENSSFDTDEFFAAALRRSESEIQQANECAQRESKG